MMRQVGELYAIFPFNGFNFAYGTKGQNGPAVYYDFPSKDLPLEDQAKEFIRLNDIRQTDLVIALTKSDENIWISGKYIAIKYSEFKKLLLKLYKIDDDSVNDKAKQSVLGFIWPTNR